MYLIFAIFFPLSVHCIPGIDEPLPIPKRWTNNIELERLSKVLNPIITREIQPPFYDDFIKDAFRYNLSVNGFAATCFEAYLEMKFSAAEHNIGYELPYLSGIMQTANISTLPENWQELAVLTSSVISDRKDMINKLSATALPETKRFLREVVKSFEEYFEALLFNEKYVNDGKFLRKAIDHDTTQYFVKQIAFKYNNLSSLAKIDLERTFCARNVLNWLKSDAEGAFNNLFDAFSDVVKKGMNVDEILRNSDYLTLEDLQHEIYEISKNLNIPAQEFADNCAKTISVMTFSKDESIAFNQSTDVFMGKKWGKTVFNTTDELLTVLYNESAPFIKVVDKRWNFINQHPMIIGADFVHLNNVTIARELIRYELLETLLKFNNRAATNSQVKIRLLPEEMFEKFYGQAVDIDLPLRQVEKNCCLFFALELIMKTDDVMLSKYFFFLLLLTYVQCFDSPYPKFFSNRDFKKLSKILGSQFSKDFDFLPDFDSEIVRYNFSAKHYTDTCKNLFLEMKLSPNDHEMTDEFPLLKDFLNNHSISDGLPDELSGLTPHIHTFVKSRRAIIKHLLEKSLPETKAFIYEIDNLIISSLIEIISEGELNLFNPNIFNETIVKVGVTLIAAKYKKLPTAIKIDLERSLCIRNVLKWLNIDANRVFDELFNLFWDIVGLNITELMKGIEYLTRLSRKEIREKMKKKADELKMPAQEYVDTCAKGNSVLKLSTEEKALFNQSNEIFISSHHFMGKNWGKTVFNSSEEIEKEFSVKLLEINNREALHRTEKIRLLSTELYYSFDKYVQREMERSFCFQLVVESMLEREFENFYLTIIDYEI